MVPVVAVVERHADRLRRVLENGYIVLRRNERERVHVRGDVLEVDGHDRGRAFRDLRRDVGRIEREGFVHFGEHDVGAHRDHGADRRDERECGHDDLVARTDAQRSQRYAQRGRSARHRERVAATERIAHRRFERVDAGRRAGRVVAEQRSVAQHRGDGVDLGVAELVDALPERQPARDRGSPAVDREPIRLHAWTYRPATTVVAVDTGGSEP